MTLPDEKIFAVGYATTIEIGLSPRGGLAEVGADVGQVTSVNIAI